MPEYRDGPTHCNFPGRTAAVAYGAMYLAVIGIASAVAAGIAALFGGSAVAWRRSDLGRARARAARAAKPVKKEAQRYRAALVTVRRPAEDAARRFAAEQRERRMREVPVDKLREAGAANVRWSALEEAGYATLADVRGKSARELAHVHGVGKKTGARVASAARALAQRIDEEPAALPSAALDTEAARALAARTMAWLVAREIAGDDADRVALLGEQLAERLARVRRATSFASWATSAWNRERTERALTEARALADEAEQLALDGTLERAREGRQRVARARLEPLPETEVADRFRARYAECCALLEELFVSIGLRPDDVRARGQGGLSDEIARRVEAQPLRCAGLRATLRRYQEFGAKYVLAQERTILGDEMGLGKTMQTLAAMLHVAGERENAHFFVVAPAGILLNWMREIAERTPLEGFLLHGDAVEGGLAHWAREGGIAVTSYDTLRNLRLADAVIAAGGRVDLLAVDEAHYVKNPAAGRSQAVRRLAEASDRVVLLSGTPMENHPEEFLHLIGAIRPDDAAALREQDLELDAAAGSVRRFHQAVAKVYLRRNQEDVLTELPERIEVAEWVEPGPDELAAYRAEVLAGNFMGMRRRATLGADGRTSAKLDHLAELLDDHRESGRKVLVFAYFLDVLKALAARFDVVGTIDGSVPPEGRQALCDRFSAHDGHAILLLQIQAGGQGLNLQAASVVVLTEPQTKPTTEAQAIARAHRMGQTRRVIVHRLLARGTCDETLLELLASKDALFQAYARKSLVKEASAQATATEASLAKAVVVAEQQRLAEPEPETTAPAGSPIER